jgi:hypothetical protein
MVQRDGSAPGPEPPARQQPRENERDARNVNRLGQVMDQSLALPRFTVAFVDETDQQWLHFDDDFGPVLPDIAPPSIRRFQIRDLRFQISNFKFEI